MSALKFQFSTQEFDNAVWPELLLKFQAGGAHLGVSFGPVETQESIANKLVQLAGMIRERKDIKL